ncbi:PAS domain S-box protein [Mucilaginibacter sp. HD30]
MKQVLQWYRSIARRNLASSIDSNTQGLGYWKDELFCNFLLYCLPISLIALLPGVYMALTDGFPIIAVVDLASFAAIAIITFSDKFTLLTRKVLTLTVLYLLAIFLINTLGYMGPGVFYLFFVTVLSALIFPIRVGYTSVIINTVILIAFAFIIDFKLFNTALAQQYTTGKWIAFSVNLIFVSVVILLLIDKIFERLQLSIVNLTQLQERYRQIFDKSPLPMWLFDTGDYKFVEVNEAAIRNYGYSKAEFTAMTIMDIRYPESVQRTAKLVDTNKLSGEFYGGVSQHIKKSGDTILVKIESNLLELDGRRVRLVQATDITTQVEHQVEVFNYNQKIKESESNLRALFDSAIDGFVLLDSLGTIKLYNTKALEAMEFNKDQKAFEIGDSIFDYVETSRLDYFRKVMDRVYQGETIDYDRMFRVDGASIWIRYTVTPVRERKRVIGACIAGRDITERKFYLRSVEEQNKVFREISWMQSHLVRAPLASIMGLLPMLSSEPEDGTKEQVVEYLNVSANQLDKIIWQIIEKSTSVIEQYPEQGQQNQGEG